LALTGRRAACQPDDCPNARLRYAQLNGVPTVENRRRAIIITTMARLDTFSFSDMMNLRADLRGAFEGGEPSTMEEAAQRLAVLLRTRLLDEGGQPACALVRIYKTHPFGDLDAELQAFARAIEPEADRVAGLRCLVLIATVGDQPAWNSRHMSQGHRAIPLTSEAAVSAAPMIAQLIQQLGLDVKSVLKPEPGFILDTRDQAQNVFYVPSAVGSPHIPAQEEFVLRYGIQSVIGFGGLVASGDLVAAILFTKVAVTPRVADLFKVIGLNFKLALLPYTRKTLFLEPTPPGA
jgi:hypothetical protein